MYDAGKIIAGVLLFLFFLSFPVWYIAATGQASYVPELKVDSEEKQCLESKEYMRQNHMVLINEWREKAVREGIRTYVASDGKEYEVNLSGTCLRCHKNKAEFCDKCHNYAGVKPYCWDCHIAVER